MFQESVQKPWKRLKMTLFLDDIVLNRPLLSSAILISFGIILSYYLKVSTILIIIFLILMFVFVFLAILKEETPVLLIITVVILAGFCLMGWQEIKYKSDYSLSKYNGTQGLEVIGEVKEDLSSLQGNKIFLEPYYIAGNPIKYGLIQLDKRYIPAELKNGDIIKLKLTLYEPYKQMNPGGFSNYNYLKRKGVYSQGYFENNLESIGQLNNLVIDSIINFKYQLINLIDQSVEYPYNELFKALLLGERDSLPEAWNQYFTLAGVNHLLAISGLHVGFIVLIILYILNLTKLPIALRNLLLSLIMILYIILTGFRASVFRAGLLSITFLWAPFFNRKGDVLNILGMTAFLNLLINPYQLFSVGFQLSYFILLMIILWYKILEKHISSVFPLSTTALSISTAALLGSSPFTAYYFNMITPVAIISNIWAIPLMGLLVSMALIGVILGFIHPIFTAVIFKILIFPTKLLIFGTGMMSSIPYGNFEVATPSVITLIFSVFLLLVLPFILNKRIIPYNEIKRKKRLYILIIFTMFFIFITVITPLMNKKLEICFISVGQGDSILLRSPDNHYVMVDGGGYLGYQSNSTQGEYAVLPYLKHRGIRELDIVFITHFDADHAIGILDILEKRRVNLLVLPYNFEGNEIAAKIIDKAANTNVPIVMAGEGDYFELGEVNLNLLNPEYEERPISRNEKSLVIKVEYRKFSVLLTGDLEKEGERRLKDYGYLLNSDILKFGHHGSNSSSTEGFLEQVGPQHGIISVGNNNYGHPSDKVLSRALANDISVWRTDIQGAIIVRSDGFHYSIEGHLKE